MTSPGTDTAGEGETVERVVIPEPSGPLAERRSFRKLLCLMAMFGPGAIVASIAIGAGETIVVFRAGSWAGYDLLWVVLLACLVKGVFLTYLLGRYTAISGEHVGHRLVRLPGPRGWFLLLIVVLELAIAPLIWAAIAKPCGDLFRHLLAVAQQDPAARAVWANLLTTAFVALACGFGLLLSFERLERQQLVICGILVGGTIIGTLMVRPDFGEALLGCLNFGRLPEKLPPWTPADARQHSLLTVATVFGYVGGTTMGYLVYAHWIDLHGWGLTGHEKIEAVRRRALAHAEIDYLPDDPEQVRRLRGSVAPLRWDAGMGALVLFIVSGAFMMAGAAVLYPMLASGELTAGFQGWDLLTDQAHVWRGIHPWLVWVYYVCIIAALWGTLQALPEAYARVTQEFFQAIWPRRPWSYHKIRLVICVYLFITTSILVWSGASFDLLIQIASFLVSNLGLALVMWAALYLNHKLPPAYRTRWPVLAGGVLSAVALTAFAAISGWGLAVKLLGGG